LLLAVLVRGHSRNELAGTVVETVTSLNFKKEVIALGNLRDTVFARKSRCIKLTCQVFSSPYWGVGAAFLLRL